MLAAMFKAETLAITEDEAKKLAEATGRVTRHYNIPAASQEVVDWANLVMAIGAVYGPRIIARQADKAMREQAEADGKVIDINAGHTADR